MAAESQLDTITADLCVNYLAAWRNDGAEWRRFSNGVNNVGSTRRAMEFLELKTWTLAEFGVGIVDSETDAANPSALKDSEMAVAGSDTDVVDSEGPVADAWSYETASVPVTSVVGV
jgi:hypothetical protein